MYSSTDNKHLELNITGLYLETIIIEMVKILEKLNTMDETNIRMEEKIDGLQKELTALMKENKKIKILKNS